MVVNEKSGAKFSRARRGVVDVALGLPASGMLPVVR